MTQDWKHRYWFLSIELAGCAPAGSSDTERIQAGLRVAEKNWMDLRGIMLAYEFKSMEEEIVFFKVIKPLFVSELEYFRLLENAGRCRPPENDSAAVKAFTNMEQKRLAAFKNEQDGFYEYYKNNRTHKDHQWFVRQAAVESSHDHLVTRLLALEKYQRYHENGSL